MTSTIVKFNTTVKQHVQSIVIAYVDNSNLGHSFSQENYMTTIICLESTQIIINQEENTQSDIVFHRNNYLT